MEKTASCRDNSIFKLVVRTIAAFILNGIAIDRRDTVTWRFPILVSSTFGLLHGIGFASALSEIGLPQTEIPAALLSFNVGVEIGQVVFVVVIIAIAYTLQQAWQLLTNDTGKRIQTIAKPMAYAVGSVTVFWTLERVSAFWVRMVRVYRSCHLRTGQQAFCTTQADQVLCTSARISKLCYL